MFGMRPRPPAPPAFEAPPVPQLPAAPAPSAPSAGDASAKMREAYGSAAQNGKISTYEQRQVGDARQNVGVMGEQLGDLKQNDAAHDEEDAGRNPFSRLFGGLF